MIKTLTMQYSDLVKVALHDPVNEFCDRRLLRVSLHSRDIIYAEPDHREAVLCIPRRKFWMRI